MTESFKMDGKKMGKKEFDFVLEKEIKLFARDIELKIGSLSQLTGVKAGTIRFYEKCGFLEPAKRLPNGYRVFCRRHIYQIQVCRLVFGGFVNKRLRKISRSILQASRNWNLEAYRQAADRYLRAVEEDIRRTKIAVDFVMDKLQEISEDHLVYTKNQAAGLVGVTSETIRNWERNGLFRLWTIRAGL